MPKRKKAKNLQNEQPTHTPHPHNKIPPKFPRIHPEVSQIPRLHTPSFSCAKMPSFRTLQQSTPKFHNAPKSKVSGYLKQPSKFPYTHEVREFLTIQRPQCTRPNTHIPPPKSFGVSDSLQNSPPFKGKFHTLGSRLPTARATANGR